MKKTAIITVMSLFLSLSSCSKSTTDSSSTTNTTVSSNVNNSSSSSIHVHSYTSQTIEDKYLKDEATCTTSKVYYYSCSCGQKGTETFSYGDALGHDYTIEEVTDDCFKEESTCNHAALYYKRCSRCNQIGDKTFEYGTVIKDHNFVDGVCSVCNALEALTYSYDEDSDSYIFTGFSQAKDGGFTIPKYYNDKEHGIKTVTKIEDEAFKEKATWTAGVKNIITIPESVIEIGSKAFMGCAIDGLNFEGDSKLEKIGDDAFNNNNISQIIFPSSLKEIGKNAFRSNGLETLVLPENISVVQEGTFAFNSAMKSLYIPANIQKIENDAFRATYSLTQITFENDSHLESIGNEAFQSSEKLKEFVMPDSVTTIGDNVFKGCVALEKITLSKNLTKISKGTFKECTSLKEVVLPSTINKIADEAFYNCSSLEEITIPENVNFIGINAFTNCSNLKSITTEYVGKWTLSSTVDENDNATDAELVSVDSSNDPTVNSSYFTDTYKDKYWIKDSK